MENIRIPVGEENFEKIRTNGFYYIDKTRFIEDLLMDQFTVNLITRPRRFGKTLAMSMLKNFFDIRKDSNALFEGLEIAENVELCRKWMNQWPVLFITFKDMANSTFSDSYDQFVYNISSLCVEHAYLADSDRVNISDRNCFSRLMERSASNAEVRNSLFMLTRMMYMHYGKPAILLIDEYDVPLAKACEYGYYQEMLDVIQSVMSTSFKTNDFLQFAVVTGCLRIARESIFTGTNHFVTNSIYDGGYMDIFGFTDTEVKKVLSDTGLDNHFSDMRNWYDGYHFGKYDVFCPWDVVNYTVALMREPGKEPGNYWKDTSHNDIIKRFIGREEIDVNEKIEILLAGGYVRVLPAEDLTYDFENASERDFWSILYLTGYLTSVEKDGVPKDELINPGEVCLKIPNEEVKTIFGDTIVEWFMEIMPVKAQERREMFSAWWAGDDTTVTEAVSEILSDSISYYDYREDYYHAFVAGLFSGAGYIVTSNDENGLGRSDVVVKDRKRRRVIIIEVKRSETEAQMEDDCSKALKQIDLKQYAKRFLKGYKTVLCYGAAFYDKECVIHKIELAGQGKGNVYEIE